MTRVLMALFVLLVCSTALGQHNKWGVEPVDIEKEFVPYVVSFDGDDDNDGDGDPDLWRIPEWVAYEIKRGPDRSTLTNRPSWKTDEELFSQETHRVMRPTKIQASTEATCACGRSRGVVARRPIKIPSAS